MIFNMERVLEILLQRIELQHITRHIVCPSVEAIVKNRLKENYITILDERSAGYVATGMCAEANEPVVIWCANDLSFRNLAPALTEAYYRKLPLFVIAISGTDAVDQNMNPEDIVRYKYQIPLVATVEEIKSIIVGAIQKLQSVVQGPTWLIVNDDIVIVEEKENVHSNERKNADGKLSKLIGAAIVDPEHLHIGYFSRNELERDINMFGNRHVLGNVVVVNEQGNVHHNVLLDFAKRMQWMCVRCTKDEFDNMTAEFSIEDHPQYIEIV